MWIAAMIFFFHYIDWWLLLVSITLALSLALLWPLSAETCGVDCNHSIIFYLPWSLHTPKFCYHNRCPLLFQANHWRDDSHLELRGTRRRCNRPNHHDHREPGRSRPSPIPDQHEVSVTTCPKCPQVPSCLLPETSSGGDRINIIISLSKSTTKS
jgi:hypothetical protein